jgi:hypothetical protein
MKLQVPILLSLLFLFCSKGFSQTKDSIPAFGKIDKTTLQLNECDFDKNAEALVLFDVESVVCKEYPNNVYTEIERHIRIKILNNKGLENANIKIAYIKQFDGENLNIADAQTYNLDASGNITVAKLDKKTIVDKEVNKKIWEKIFTFPEVRVGSVIEYSYKIDGPVSSGLRNWNFQTSIPVKFSRYSVDFPDNIELVCMPHCTLPVDAKSFTYQQDNIKVFTMTDVPALRNEPYMTCENDYRQRVDLNVVAVTSFSGRRTSLNESWPEIINRLMNDDKFGQQLDKNIPGTDDLEESLKKVVDPYKKMNVIYHYVRDNMHWNGQTSIWAKDGVKFAWKNKRGTTGEINLILVNLLKDAGLEVYPVLVSTRSNGRINVMMPAWSQFDKVLALVVINNRNYVLDGTDKFTPPKLIPWEVMASEGLVIEKYQTFKWGWQTLWNDNGAFKETTLISGTIDSSGILTGEATVNSYDYSRAERMEKMKDGKEKFIENYFASKNASLHIDSSLIENEAVDSMPLIQQVWYNEKLSSSGNYKYFSTNLFTGFEVNPFTADRRFSDIFFGANQNYTIIENFFIPDGYSFDEMPKNIKMIMPDTSIVFTRIVSAQNDLLNMRITLQFTKPFFTADEYESFREFYDKLIGMLNEQIVIKKVN